MILCSLKSSPFIVGHYDTSGPVRWPDLANGAFCSLFVMRELPPNRRPVMTLELTPLL